MSTQVMGVLNVTPDSFSDGGRWFEPADAVARGLLLLEHGARVVDVGGESTRPGADPVDPATEADRVVPVFEALVGPAADLGARVSVDTRHQSVARAAVAAGASFVNDVSATLGPLCAELGVAWCAMHMLGTPATMQAAPTYGDVVDEVLTALLDSVATAAGCPEVWIDPGIGFGKTADHNWTLLAALDRFVATGIPVLVGASRKSFLGAVTGGAPVEDRLSASITTATWAAMQGVAMVRAHDVRETVQAVTVVGPAAPQRLVTLTGGA